MRETFAAALVIVGSSAFHGVWLQQAIVEATAWVIVTGVSKGGSLLGNAAGHAIRSLTKSAHKTIHRLK